MGGSPDIGSGGPKDDSITASDWMKGNEHNVVLLRIGRLQWQHTRVHKYNSIQKLACLAEPYSLKHEACQPCSVIRRRHAVPDTRTSTTPSPWSTASA